MALRNILLGLGKGEREREKTRKRERDREKKRKEIERERESKNYTLVCVFLHFFTATHGSSLSTAFRKDFARAEAKMALKLFIRSLHHAAEMALDPGFPGFLWEGFPLGKPMVFRFASNVRCAA